MTLSRLRVVTIKISFAIFPATIREKEKQQQQIEVVKKSFPTFSKKKNFFHSSFLLSRNEFFQWTFFRLSRSHSKRGGWTHYHSLFLKHHTKRKLMGGKTLTSYHLIRQKIHSRLQNPMNGKESIWDLFNRVNSLIQLKSQVQFLWLSFLSVLVTSIVHFLSYCHS